MRVPTFRTSSPIPMICSSLALCTSEDRRRVTAELVECGVSADSMKAEAMGRYMVMACMPRRCICNIMSTMGKAVLAILSVVDDNFSLQLCWSLSYGAVQHDAQPG